MKKNTEKTCCPPKLNIFQILCSNGSWWGGGSAGGRDGGVFYHGIKGIFANLFSFNSEAVLVSNKLEISVI